MASKLVYLVHLRSRREAQLQRDRLLGSLQRSVAPATGNLLSSLSNYGKLADFVQFANLPSNFSSSSHDGRSIAICRLFSAGERKRGDQRTSSGRQRLGHGTDHFDRDIDVALRAVDRSHRSRPIPSSSLAIRRLLLQLPSAVLQMRASVRHAGASKRENRTFVKDCLTNRAKHETRLDRRCLSAATSSHSVDRENEDRTREYSEETAAAASESEPAVRPVKNTIL